MVKIYDSKFPICVHYICILILIIKDLKVTTSDTSQISNNFTLTMRTLQVFLKLNDQFCDLVIVLPKKNLISVPLENVRFDQKTVFMSIESYFDVTRTNEIVKRVSRANKMHGGNTLVVFLHDCAQVIKLAQAVQTQQTEVLFKTAVWLIISNSCTFSKRLSSNFSKSWFLTGVLNAQAGIVDVYENYRPAKQHKFISNFKYSLNATNVLTENCNCDMETYSQVMSSERTRSNFNRLPFRIAAVMDLAFAFDTNITKIQDGNTSIYEYHESLGIEVLKALEYTMNFTIDLRVTDAWGHLVNNSTWVGMIQLLLEDEADMAISSTASLPFRRQVVDFNMPTNELRLTAFFQQPRSISKTKALIEPFSWDLWLAICIWLILASMTMICLQKTLMWFDSANAEIEEHLWDDADCFQWALGTICLQGFYNLPTVACLRVVIGIGCLSGMLIYAVYAGTLISFLSVVVEPIKSMEQLLATDFVFSVEDSPIPRKFLSESPNQQTKKLFERRRLEPQYGSTSMASKELTKGSFVFIVNNLNGYESLNHDFRKEDACNIREMIIQGGEQKQGSMVRQNSSFKRTIDFHILRMHEYGLVKKWNKKYLEKKPNCDSNHPFLSVDFQSVSLSIFILLTGMSVAMVLILIERLFPVDTDTNPEQESRNSASPESRRLTAKQVLNKNLGSMSTPSSKKLWTQQDR